MKVPYTYEEKTGTVDVDIWMPFMKALLKKYGDFKISQELYNLIIYNLCEICDAIETQSVKGK